VDMYDVKQQKGDGLRVHRPMIALEWLRLLCVLLLYYCSIFEVNAEFPATVGVGVIAGTVG